MMLESNKRNDFLPDSCLPTFIGVGSMRCGSTWLSEVLKRHPDVRIADHKEMDYFFMSRMLHHDLEWYQAHFRPRGRESQPIRGEISPRYARLKAWQVQKIAKLLPSLRLILTLRHPVDRLWSQTLYDFGHLSGKDIRHVRTTAFMRQVDRARSQLSSDYARTIQNWTAAFGRESLHIGFYEQLRDDPQAFVSAVLKHIGASTTWSIPEELTKTKVWATNNLVKHEREIPQVIHWYMARQLLEPTERLNELLDGRVSAWVSEIRAKAAEAKPSWRLMRVLSRALFVLPERLAYEGYHAALDARMRLRWQHLRANLDSNFAGVP